MCVTVQRKSRTLTKYPPLESGEDANREVVRSAIFECLGGIYNLRRLRSALSYRNPADHESLLVPKVKDHYPQVARLAGCG
jgi:hypothetical protein